MAMISNGFKMFVAGLVLFGPAAATAQSYPAKPVRIIVPFPAGGGADIMARTIADKIGTALGQQFIVDNRTGAGGTLGSDLVAKSAPDGYTLLVSSSSPMVIGPNLMQKPPYDPLRSFSSIIIISSAPNVLVIHPSVPVKNVKELITLAQQRPGQLNYASNGAGTLSHLTGELFSQRTGIKMVHVPYRGAPPAVIDTVAGNVSLLFSAYPTVSVQVQNKRLRALAVTGGKRASVAPELPSIAETLPGFESSQWWGMFGPAGLSSEAVNRLNASAQQALTLADVRKRLAADAADPVGGSAAEAEKFLQEDHAKWAKVIRDAGVKAN
jgi:tripartite-type tricarboxylate transporter receptor subunit TctC